MSGEHLRQLRDREHLRKQSRVWAAAAAGRSGLPSQMGPVAQSGTGRRSSGVQVPALSPSAGRPQLLSLLADTVSIEAGWQPVVWDGTQGVQVGYTVDGASITTTVAGVHVLHPTLTWASFTGGGSVRILVGDTVVWGPDQDPQWTASSGGQFAGTVALSLDRGDTVTVEVNSGHASAQTASAVRCQVSLPDPEGVSSASGGGTPSVRPTYPFLAAYGSAGLLGSPNGIDWFDQGTVMPWETAVQTRDIKWIPEHSLWLASSSSNRVATSPDGLLWTPIVTPFVITGSRTMGRIGWDGSTCIIGCDSSAATSAPFVLRSTDLASWTIIEDATNLGRTNTPLKVGTRWVVKNANGAAYSDNGGLTWVKSSLSTSQNGFLSQDGNGNLYRHASNNTAHWSTDGAVWSTATNPEGNEGAWVGHYSSRLNLVLLPNRLGRVYTTVNFPPSWTLRETGSAATVNVIKETANGIFVAGMSDGTVWTSPDSISWTNRTTTPGGASVTAVGGDGSV